MILLLLLFLLYNEENKERIPMKKEMSEETTKKIATKTSQHKKDKDDFMEKYFLPNLRKALENKGMKQTELATKIDVSPQVISNWFGNRATPDILNLSRISDVLDISIDSLCGKNEERISSDIENFKGLLSSMWKQYRYCKNYLCFHYSINERQMKYTSKQLEAIKSIDNFKPRTMFEISIDYEGVQIFLETLKKFDELYSDSFINEEMFNNFIEAQIDRISLDYENDVEESFICEDLPF